MQKMRNREQEVNFENEHSEIVVNLIDKLQDFLLQKIKKEAKWQQFYIQYVFLDDEALLEINKEFLNHDYYTDIITFDLSSEEDCLESDIYISLDRVKENAKNLNIIFDEELHRVLFHGILHLLGWNDASKEDEAKMREQENIWIEEFNTYLNEN